MNYELLKHLEEIDANEVLFYVNQIQKGELTAKTLSQRIYRLDKDDYTKYLTYKLVQAICQKGVN